MIAVTGTDGKSTTTWILASILQKEFLGKKSVYISGNFDIPFSATVLQILQKQEKKGVIVLEVSSFMAYALREFSPDYTIFTNFASDHLNWHRDLREYFLAKWNLVERTQKCAIIAESLRPFLDSYTLPNTEKLRFFGTSPELRDRVEGDDIILSGRKKYQLSETPFAGLHNALNILACTCVTNEM